MCVLDKAGAAQRQPTQTANGIIRVEKEMIRLFVAATFYGVIWPRTQLRISAVYPEVHSASK
jgi:hypothetical protein